MSCRYRIVVKTILWLYRASVYAKVSNNKSWQQGCLVHKMHGAVKYAKGGNYEILCSGCFF